MTNKLRYFIANWKMYGDLKSLKSINKVIKFAKSNKNKRFKLIYCQKYTLLRAFCAKLISSGCTPKRFKEGEQLAGIENKLETC